MIDPVDARGETDRSDLDRHRLPLRSDQPREGRSSSIARATFPARATRISIVILSGPKTGKNGRHPLPDIDVISRNFSDLGISTGHAGRGLRRRHRDVCRAGLWWMLRWMGHDAVAVLDGGLARWQREGHPVRGGVESSTHGQLQGLTASRLAPDASDEVAEGPRQSAAPARRFANAASVIAASAKPSTRSAATSPARPTTSSSRT